MEREIRIEELLEKIAALNEEERGLVGKFIAMIYTREQSKGRKGLLSLGNQRT